MLKLQHLKRSVVTIVVFTIILVYLEISLELFTSLLKPDLTYSKVQRNMVGHLEELRTELEIQGDRVDLLTFVRIQDIYTQLMGPEGLGTSGNNRSFYSDEKRRRNLNYLELWYNIRPLENHTDNNSFARIQDICRSIKADVLNLRAADGYEAYRASELAELSNLIQGRLHKLQNPSNCELARKLQSNFGHDCGFGCSAHRNVYALLVSYATGRTLILEPQKWRAWENIFIPISTNCTSLGINITVEKFDGKERQKGAVVSLLKSWYMKYFRFGENARPEYSVPSIPLDIADRLERVHGEPRIWWVGQLLSFLFTLRPEIQEMVDNKTSRWDPSCRTVGVHIRRSDKLLYEAQYHSLQEYMDRVEDYFAIMDKVGQPKGCGNTRRVFVASDVTEVIIEAKKRYLPPMWDIIGDESVAESAKVGKRLQKEGNLGIVTDVFTLAKSDFLVCTFSSFVCRFAYEIMQSKNVDASGRIESLDHHWVFYSNGDSAHQVAVLPHRPVGMLDMELSVGDKIQCNENLKNGTSWGTNMRTKRKGQFPSYKVRPLMKRVDFPNSTRW